MNIDLTLEESCTKCYGAKTYYDEEQDYEEVECDCNDGMQLTELGKEILDLVKKYIK